MSNSSRSAIAVVASCLAVGGMAQRASAAPSLTTLVSFNGANGATPASTLSIDNADGTLYGTTPFGGPGVSSASAGDGTVFALQKQNYRALITLFAFSGPDGSNPSSALVLDPPNRLFGTTSSGGANGDGSVFELSHSNGGTFTRLASFTLATGADPTALVALPAIGTGDAYTLYGTTIGGGTTGNGTVFKLSGPSLTTLAATTSFPGSFAEHAGASLVAGPNGVLYGTSSAGGQYGQGIVFSLSGPNYATLTVLATFNGSNGAFPQGGLAVDKAGNVYGTTSTGGPNGDGSVFELSGARHGQLTTLVSFASSDPHGAEPQGSLLIDAAGRIFGTNSTAGGASESGTVFEISANHAAITVLHSFNGGADGAEPIAGLVNDGSGVLYGTTAAGGTSGKGTVFRIDGAGFSTGTN